MCVCVCVCVGVFVCVFLMCLIIIVVFDGASVHLFVFSCTCAHSMEWWGNSRLYWHLCFCSFCVFLCCCLHGCVCLIADFSGRGASWAWIVFSARLDQNLSDVFQFSAILAAGCQAHWHTFKSVLQVDTRRMHGPARARLKKFQRHVYGLEQYLDTPAPVVDLEAHAGMGGHDLRYMSSKFVLRALMYLCVLFLNTRSACKVAS